MSDVFISYKAEDRRRVQPLVQALQADGLSVWWDEHIGAGDSWRETIERQLDEAKCVVVIWSKRSVGPDGKFVRDEASRAQRRGAYVPILLDAVDPPLGFGESQATSLRGWHGNASDPHYQAVLSAVRRNVGGKRRASRAAVPQPGVDRRTAITGGAVAAIAVAGVGAWALLRPSSPGAAPSIAVLPFANLSGDPAEAYFADGIAEEIRSALGRLGGLTVIGRTSSEAVRNDDAPTAARKLAVASILTGSVRQSPSTMRISAELIDGRTGADRWSEDYDRAPGDAIKIQTDIAEKVATALSATLAVAVRKAIEVGGTQNADAQKLYLRSDPSHIDESAARVQRAVDDLNQAIRLDPNYAAAYARKARTLAFFASVYAHGPAELRQTLDECEAAAQRAITLAPTLTEAHSALAYIYRQQLRFRDSLRESQIGVNQPGATPAAYGSYATILAQCGHADAAIRIVNREVSVDPLNPGAFETKALVLFMSHRFEAAAAAAKHALDLAPARTYTRSVLAYALIMLHRFDEAKFELSKLPPDDVHALMSQSVIAWIAGDKNTSDRLYARINARYGQAANYQYAQIYAQRRDADGAIAALRRAVAMQDPGLAWIKADPFLDPIRNDARLADIIRQLDFPA